MLKTVISKTKFTKNNVFDEEAYRHAIKDQISLLRNKAYRIVGEYDYAYEYEIRYEIISK